MTDAQLDVEALYAALDVRRQSLGLSWRQVALAAKVSASTLTRMGQGKRPDVDSFAALVDWLGVPSDQFLTRIQPRKPAETDLLTVVSTHLRARKDLSPDSAKALQEIIRVAYNQLKKRNAKT